MTIPSLLKRMQTSSLWNLTIAFIVLNSLVWWVTFSLAQHFLDPTGDMVENYAWGVHWQWGNNKHPPLFGWIVAAWFTLFPTKIWAYFLLTEVNLGAALVLLAMALRRVLTPERVLTAIILTTLVSRFGFDIGFKYNANSALYPFVAGFAWALLRALQDKSLRYFLWVGIFAAAAFLTKYYALVILPAVGLGIVLSLRPSMSELIKGAALAIGVGTILVVYHLIWSWQHGWPSLGYMHEAHEAAGFLDNLKAHAAALWGVFLFSSISLAVWGAGLLHQFYKRPAPPASPPKQGRMGLCITFLTIALTLIASFLNGVTPTSAWFTPALLFLGFALVELTPPWVDVKKQMQTTLRIGLAYLVIVLTVGLAWEAHSLIHHTPSFHELQRQVSRDVTRLYHQEYGQQPIAFVAGTHPLPYAMAFYSPDHPAAVYGWDIEHSYWIDAKALQQGNKVVICGITRTMEARDQLCMQEAKKLFGKPDKVLHLAYKGYTPQTADKYGHDNDYHYDVLFWKPR